jgi:hypothetical protein
MAVGLAVVALWAAGDLSGSTVLGLLFVAALGVVGVGN